MERCKMDIKSMETFCPSLKDRNNRPTTARAEQPADYRPTTGLPSVIERCKAGTTPDVPVTTRRPVLPPRQPVQPLAPSTSISASPRQTTQRNYRLPGPVLPPCMSSQRNNRPLDRYYRPCLRAVTWAKARVPFRYLDYKYSIPYNFLGLALV